MSQASLDLAVNGVRYHARVAGDGPPLVLLHGFTGSSATWEPHLAVLGGERRLVAVDLLGHGSTQAPREPERYGVEPAVADLLALLALLGVDRFALLGYSMGGRLALHLALAAPQRVQALVLESASPGIREQQEREARRRTDDELADFVEREGIEAFVARWEALPLFASQANLPLAVREQLRAQRLAQDPLGLANSLRGMGAGVMPSVEDRLGTLAMPILIVAGRLDDKYCRLAHAMQQHLARACVEIVPDAGHAVHLEQPVVFDRLVCGFLE